MIHRNKRTNPQIVIQFLKKVQHRLAKNHPVLIRRLNHLHPNIQQIIQQSLSLLPQRHSKQLTLYPAVNLAVTQPFTSLV